MGRYGGNADAAFWSIPEYAIHSIVKGGEKRGSRNPGLETNGAAAGPPTSPAWLKVETLVADAVKSLRSQRLPERKIRRQAPPK